MHDTDDDFNVLSVTPRRCSKPQCTWSTAARPLFCLVLVIFAIVAIIWLPIWTWFEDFVAWSKAHSVAAIFSMLAAFSILASTFLPCAWLMIGCGYIFGWWGMLVVWVTYNVGSWVGYGMGRWLLQDLVVVWADQNKYMKAMTNAVKAKAFRVVLLVQMAPISLPYGMACYLFGACLIPLHTFALATASGGTVSIFFYVYLGTILSNIASVVDGKATSGPGYWIPAGCGLALALAALVYFAQIARKELQAITDSEERRSTAELLTSPPRDAEEGTENTINCDEVLYLAAGDHDEDNSVRRIGSNELGP